MASQQENAPTPLVLVTGAGGFVGSVLVRTLLNQGARVRAMVHSRTRQGALADLPVEVVEADLSNLESLRAAVRGVQQVYHIASIFRQAGLPESVFHDVNATGTQRLLDACIEAGVQRVIHCSTVGVLGHIDHPPADENTPFNPGDMYQRSKMDGEKIALDYFRQGKIRGVVIRPAMIYGPGDERTLKMFRMIAHRRFFFVGPGKALVHFIDVRDLAVAFTLAMQKPDLNGEVYIVAGPRALPLVELVDIIARELGVPPLRLHLPIRPMQMLGSLCEAVCTPFRIQPPIFRRRVDFYTKNRAFDCRKAHRDLGFVPAQTLEQEIRDIIADYRQRSWL
jgi:dihydroflavonol-4-reductase